VSEPLEGELLPAVTVAGRADVAVSAPVVRDEVAAKWLLAQDSANTRAAYGQNLRELFDWADEFGINVLGGVTRSHIDAYRMFLRDGGTGRQLANSTIARKLSAVSSFYAFAAMQRPDLVPANPAAGVRRPKPPREATSTWLELDEVHRLFEAADRSPWPAAPAWVRVLVYTGMRVSELCGARSSDLRVEGGDLTMAITRKGNVPDRVVLPRDAADVLAQYRAGRVGPLFLHDGAPITPDRVTYQLRVLTRQAGIRKRLTPHCLRHTAATLAKASGYDLREIQQLLRHRQITTTERYEHASRDAAARVSRGIAALVTGADEIPHGAMEG
jgi:site-specific recombinase XerD